MKKLFTIAIMLAAGLLGGFASIMMMMNEGQESNGIIDCSITLPLDDGVDDVNVTPFGASRMFTTSMELGHLQVDGTRHPDITTDMTQTLFSRESSDYSGYVYFTLDFSKVPNFQLTGISFDATRYDEDAYMRVNLYDSYGRDYLSDYCYPVRHDGSDAYDEVKDVSHYTYYINPYTDGTTWRLRLYFYNLMVGEQIGIANVKFFGTMGSENVEVTADVMNYYIEKYETAITNVNHAKVAGLDDAKNLIANAKTRAADTNLTDEEASTLMIQLRTAVNAIVKTDKAYSELDAALLALSEDILIDNGKKDPVKIAELQQLIANAQSGVANGTLTSGEARTLAKQILILNEKLAQVYLVIKIEERGTLGDSILEKTENFSDVKGIRLSGRLDDDDIYTLKARLTELTEVDLEGLDWENIPSELFYGRISLEKVVLPANVKTIGSYAFYNCQALSDITLREGITEIGDYAFYQTGLKDLTLPSTLKEIKYETFYNCDQLETITFNGQERINGYAFRDCDKLTSVVFPITMRTIEYEAFAYCDRLKNIELNDGLETIGNYAFSGNICSKIILPSTLNNIGYWALGDNYSLKEITCLAVVPPVLNDNNLMGNNASSRTLYVPSISLNEYKQAIGWDKFNIVGIDTLPNRINITRDYHLNWPDAVSANYKPQVAVTSVDRNNYNYYWDRRSFGSLTVEGKSTISMSDFTMVNDLYWQYNYNNYSYDENVGKKLSASLINNGVMRADNIQQKLVFPGYRWCFVTVPFDVKVSDIIQQGTDYPYVIRKYDGELRAQGKTGETWVNVTANDTLRAGQGYIWQVGGDNESIFLLNALQTVNKNNIFVNTDIEVTLNYYESEFAHNRSWNLIGNPYPSYFDIRAMKTSAPITVWNMSNWNYEAYSPADDEYILSPGQAFFVQRPLNEESITFLKKGRQSNTKLRDVDYDTKRAASSVERKVFNLTLTGNNLSDRTRFVINDDANMDYEAGRDASKFMSLDQRAVQLYTCQGTIHYAINERPLGNGIVELGLSIGTAGTYTLALNTKADEEVYLIDRANNTVTRMDGTDGYTFNATQGSLEGRFAIQLGNAGTTGIDTIGIMEQTNGTYYNLKGQRVAQPTKGLYIQNGKKVIKK